MADAVKLKPIDVAPKLAVLLKSYGKKVPMRREPRPEL